MFGAKKPLTEQTVILLDIENASIGAALAHIQQQGSAPVLFAEQRVNLAMPRTLHSSGIAKQIEAATHKALEQLSLVAARLRGNPKTAGRGQFAGASVFFGAPWGVPNLAKGSPDFSPHLQKFIVQEITAFAPGVPLNFYTGADAAAHGSMLHGYSGTMLLAIVRGEITELVLLGESGPMGYATLPVGSRSLYRTLQTHAGLSLPEMSAVLAFSSTAANPYREPLDAAGFHMIEQLAPALEALSHEATPGGIIVVAEKGVADWFARALESDDSLGALFAPDATVRTLGAHHVAKQLGGHGLHPDLHLGLGALFVQGKLNSR